MAVSAILQASVADETKKTCSGSQLKQRDTASRDASIAFLALCPKACMEFGFPHAAVDAALNAVLAHWSRGEVAAWSR